MFSTVNWKIDRGNPQWIVIRSIKGKPVSIYANAALPEETGEDEKAQKADFVVHNDGTVEELETKLSDVLAKLRQDGDR